MDGFGNNPDSYGNAIAAAKKPNLDRIFAENPMTYIGASGLDVGLPDGQMGNSEVGHTNIGAGRVVYQELVRITKAIEDGSFFRIRNVSLAYNFDKALISKIGMQALKLYVNIQNLKTWKHNTGYTPELGGSAIAFGVDDGSYPMPAIYTFGFNLTF